MRRSVLLFTLVAAILSLVGSGEEKGDHLWRFLFSRPRFRSLIATMEVQFTARSPGQIWTAKVWADPENHRMDMTFPRPTGTRTVSVVTRPDGVFVLIPDARIITQHEPAQGHWFAVWGLRPTKEPLARQNYSVRFSGRDPAASHILILELVPKHKGNPTRKIFFSARYRVPIRVEKYSPDGSLELTAMLKDAQFDVPLPAGIFELAVPEGWRVEKKRPPSPPVSLTEAAKALGFTPLVPSWTPPGYVLDGLFVGASPGWKVGHLFYTDGIGVISVFEHPSVRGEKRRRWGGGRHPVLIPLRMAKRELAGLAVVIVSDVDQTWLERMANSLVPTEAQTQ